MEMVIIFVQYKDRMSFWYDYTFSLRDCDNDFYGWIEVKRRVIRKETRKEKMDEKQSDRCDHWRKKGDRKRKWNRNEMKEK